MTNEQKEKTMHLRNKGYGYADIGRELGISKDTVKSFCRRNGLMTSDNARCYTSTNDKDKCRECGKPLIQQEKRKHKIFCCKACREKWWAKHADRINRKAIYKFTCEGCGKEFTAYGNASRKYCSHECYISHRFGGGGDNEREAISG